MSDDATGVNPPHNARLDATAILTAVLHGPYDEDCHTWATTLTHDELAAAAEVLAAMVLGIWASLGMDAERAIAIRAARLMEGH